MRGQRLRRRGILQCERARRLGQDLRAGGSRRWLAILCIPARSCNERLHKVPFLLVKANHEPINLKLVVRYTRKINNRTIVFQSISRMVQQF